jgi:glutamate synthase domain-containing protein 1
MHDRSNGLGGGFAGYGIYPERATSYAFHLMFDDMRARDETRALLKDRFSIASEEPIPTRDVKVIRDRPILYRFFVDLLPGTRRRHYDLSDADIVVRTVMEINARIDGAFVASSGRNMGVFKGVGYPEDIGDFFKLDTYRAHTWIAHGRFPTNTTGWWGGAHPFGLVNWAVVHNGEISSYGINRRYLANYGYECALRTDTEVITYMFDLLVRKHALPIETACMAMAPPFWSDIERMEPEAASIARTVRTVYGGALLNGPFSVLVGYEGGMIGFNDRIKLRPMTAARKGDRLYVASEEAAILEVCPDPDTVWQAEGGVPIIGRLKGDTVGKEMARTA